MRVLGISAFYHDSAAALIDDGHVLAAAQEERFTRRKFDARYPRESISFCLSQAGISLKDVDYCVFYEKPFLKFERLMETYFSYAPRGLRSFRESIPSWFGEKLFQKSFLLKELKREAPQFDWEKRLLFSEHHMSHAASAFFPSPFERAAVLTMDGVGEWTTTSLAIGNGNSLEVIKEIHFPHSLGLLYSAFTYHLGFKVNSGEYKVMGLAPYGEPRFVDVIRKNIIDIKKDGSFRLNQKYFDYCTGLHMTNAKFGRLFDLPVRKADEPLTPKHMDLAASLQAVTEEVVLALTRSVAEETKEQNLCLAGGVALNCVANGKVLRAGNFRALWAQPAAGDSGGALGAALAAYHGHLKAPRVAVRGDAMAGSYLGPAFATDEVSRRFLASRAKFRVLSDDQLIEACIETLVNGGALGWMQGRMEFGPRALGSRSILADARSTVMQSTLNLKIKYRESFRPFAPIVLREDVEEWFDLSVDSPYMLLVAPVRADRRHTMTEAQKQLFGIEKLNVPRSEIPAVTHVDYSARIQTVHRDTNPRLHRLLSAFKAATGCPVLVNTSFNVRGEPIVCSPEDALRCFFGTELDALAAENCFARKADQDPALKVDYRESFELD